MKNFLKRILFFAFCLMGSTAGWSQGAIITAPSVGTRLQVGGIAYKVTSETPKTVAVTYKYDEIGRLNVPQTYTGSVVIPESIIVTAANNAWSYTVTGIDDDAFMYGSGMTELTIPNTVTSVSSSAFNNANGLTSLTISDGDNEFSLSSGTFKNSPIKNLYIGRRISCSSSPFSGSSEIVLSVGNGITSVFPNLFNSATSLEKIQFDPEITSIGERAFCQCYALSSITIPNTVTAVGKTAFYYCESLKEVIIEDGEDEIGFDNNSQNGNTIFANCSIDSLYMGRNVVLLNNTSASSLFPGLKKVAIGDNVTTLPGELFKGKENLTTVYFGKNITSMGESVFAGCTKLATMDLTSKLTTIPNSSFYNCESLQSVVIPEGITSIGERAFCQCYALSSITIPNTVTAVGKTAFYYCESLKEVIIEDGEDEIGFDNNSQNGNTIFANCSIDSLYMGRNVVLLNNTSASSLFTSKLTKLAVGSNVTNIISTMFNNCAQLAKIYSLWEEPITITNSTFANAVYTNATLYVPVGTKALYQATAAWNQFASIEEMAYEQREITLDKTELAIAKGQTEVLTATCPSSWEDQSVIWESSDPTIVTVENGTIVGQKAGTATIICTSVATGQSATCKVIVGYVKLSKTKAIIEKGKTLTLKSKVYPTTEDQSVTWKSSDPTIVKVTASGKIGGKKTGTATITCTSVATGLSATCEVTVSYVKLSKTEVTIEKGKTLTLKSKVYPTTEDQSVTWKSSDPTIVKVTSSGKIGGLKAGTATITCTSNTTGLSATCEVTVVYVKLSKTEVTIEKGKTLTLKSKVYPTTEDQSVTWKSSDPTIVKVTASGKIGGKKTGTATITCTSVATGLSATCTVTVTAPAGARSLGGDDGELTDIDDIQSAVIEPFDVYDLSGRKVRHQVTSLDGLPNGVYIVNGKKVLKK